MKSHCRVCHDECLDTLKRFDFVFGYCCPECHDFLIASERALRRVGVEGVTANPVRHKPEKSEP